MKTYLALFRGINIGGHHALPMKGLVEILSGLGCENVKTYIQSGNVVFRIKGGARPEIAATISQRVLEGYGFAPQVFLLDAADLQEAVATIRLLPVMARPCISFSWSPPRGQPLWSGWPF